MTDINDLAAALDKLRAETAELKAQLAKVAEVGKPPTPFKSEPPERIDYTSGATMDRETMRDLASAIPDSLARDLRADLARGNPVTQSVAQLTPDRGGQVERGSGYRDAVPLGPPPGVPIMDRLMDMQDQIDKADLARRLAGTTAKDKER